ncbi:MAG: SDR family NAD(P)-dependent oxidoreductase [Gemmataceae bacterium]
MTDFAARYGPWALVTGASSGIGAAFARQLAARGLNVLLVARREDRLRELADELEKQNVETRVLALDLAREDVLQPVREALSGLEVGLLINNAGFATSGHFLENELADELQMLHVNCRAVLLLTHELGRQMAVRGKGGIVMVSSIVAYAGVPAWSHYSATKAYELTLGDGLARELAPRGVDVLSLCPGSTATEFWDVTKGHPGPLTMTAEAVARRALDRLGRRSVVVPGMNNKLAVWSTRLLPRSWNAWLWHAVVGRLLKKK